jgi:magnesium transporter
VDLYLANNDVRINQIMNRLTLVATIFIPLTFLTGLWGMNFKDIPELQWEHGYLFAWGCMIVCAALLTLWIKRKKWW